jgi:hypothetical protein
MKKIIEENWFDILMLVGYSGVYFWKGSTWAAWVAGLLSVTIALRIRRGMRS